MLKRIFLVLFLTVTATTAIALRLVDFGRSRPLWTDEAIETYVATADTWSEAYSRTQEMDWYPPLHPILLRLANHVSATEAMLRLPSLLAMLAAVVVFTITIWRSVGPIAGGWIAAMMAVAPPMVFYAREARPYGVGILALSLLFASWLRLWRTSRGILAFTAAAAMALATMFQLWVVVGVSIGLLIVGRKLTAHHTRVQLGAAVLIVGLVACIVFGGFYPHGKVSYSGSFFEQYLPASHAPLTVIKYLVRSTLDLAKLIVIGETPGPRWQIAGSVAGGLVLSLSAWGFVRSLKHREIWLGVHSFAWSAIAVFAILGVAWIHPYGGTRHCLPASILLLLSAAVALGQIAALGKRRLAIGLGVPLVAIALAATLRVPSPSWYRADVPGVFADLRKSNPTPEGLWVVESSYFSALFYSRQDDSWRGRIVSLSQKPTVLTTELERYLATPNARYALIWPVTLNAVVNPALKNYTDAGGSFTSYEAEGLRAALLHSGNSRRD